MQKSGTSNKSKRRFIKLFLSVVGFVLLIMVPVLNHYFPHNTGIASASHNFISRVGNKVIGDVFPSFSPTSATDQPAPAPAAPTTEPTPLPAPQSGQNPIDPATQLPSGAGSATTNPISPPPSDACGVPPHSQMPCRSPY